MTREELQQFVKTVFDTVSHRLMMKSGFYAESYDVLKNIKSGGNILGVKSETYIQTLMTKHILALYQILNSDKQNEFRECLCDEVIIDIICYLCLLYACICSSEVK